MLKNIKFFKDIKNRLKNTKVLIKRKKKFLKKYAENYLRYIKRNFFKY